MATDLTVSLVDRPGTLMRASEALARAGVNIEGACGFVCAGQGVFHVLVGDAELARRTLLNAGLEIQAERQVVVSQVENRPGEGATLLRRIAEAELNVDLLYMTADGRLVLGGDDVRGIRRALV